MKLSEIEVLGIQRLLRLNLDDGFVSSDADLNREDVQPLLTPEELLCSALKGLCEPELTPDHLSTRANTYAGVTISMDGGKKFQSLLKRDNFTQLPVAFQIGLLSTLKDLLSQSIYAVVRFRCFGTEREAEGGSVRQFLRLLPYLDDDLAAESLIQLLGVVASAGITAKDLKSLLKILADPDPNAKPLHAPVLRALGDMSDQYIQAVKAGPQCFFNFGGPGAGIKMPSIAWPFRSQYAFCAWFRLEQPSHRKTTLSHLLTMKTEDEAHGLGIDVYIKNQDLIIQVFDLHHHTTKGTPDEIVVKAKLHHGVWYNLCLIHTAVRYLAGFLKMKDEAAVYIDQEEVFKGPLHFPKKISRTLKHGIIGKDFDGQMSAVYLFDEPPPLQQLHQLAQHLGGTKSRFSRMAGAPPHRTNNDPSVDPDLKPEVIGGTYASFSSNLVLVYAPSRCAKLTCLELHREMHGLLLQRTQAWRISGAKDVITSIGGVTVMIPLFASIIPRKKDKGTPTQFSRMVSRELRMLQLTSEDFAIGGVIHQKEDPLALLMMTLARLLHSHRANQQEIARIGGIEMIAHFLQESEPLFLAEEVTGDVATALVELYSSSSMNQVLERQVAEHLVFNFDIWCLSSMELQFSLMPILCGLMYSHPNKFKQIVTFGKLLRFVWDCYIGKADEHFGKFPQSTDKVDKNAKSRRNSIQKFAHELSNKLNFLDRSSKHATLIPQVEQTILNRHSLTEAVLDFEEKKAIKRALLGMLLVMIQSEECEISKEDIEVIFNLLATCEEPFILADVVALLHALITESPNSAMALSHIEKIFQSVTNAMDFIIVRLVSNENELVQSLGIRLVTALITRSACIPRTLPHHKGKVTHRNRFNWGNFLNHDKMHFKILIKTLQKHSDLKSDTYTAILELMLVGGCTDSSMLASWYKYHQMCKCKKPFEEYEHLEVGEERKQKHEEELRNFRTSPRGRVLSPFPEFVLEILKCSEVLVDAPKQSWCFPAMTLLLKLLPRMENDILERVFKDLLLVLKAQKNSRLCTVAFRGWQEEFFGMLMPFVKVIDERTVSTLPLKPVGEPLEAEDEHTDSDPSAKLLYESQDSFNSRHASGRLFSYDSEKASGFPLSATLEENTFSYDYEKCSDFPLSAMLEENTEDTDTQRKEDEKVTKEEEEPDELGKEHMILHETSGDTSPKSVKFDELSLDIPIQKRSLSNKSSKSSMTFRTPRRRGTTSLVKEYDNMKGGFIETERKHDIWFEMRAKIYVLLLMNNLELKRGWEELDTLACFQLEEPPAPVSVDFDEQQQRMGTARSLQSCLFAEIAEKVQLELQMSPGLGSPASCYSRSSSFSDTAETSNLVDIFPSAWETITGHPLLDRSQPEKQQPTKVDHVESLLSSLFWKNVMHLVFNISTQLCKKGESIMMLGIPGIKKALHRQNLKNLAKAENANSDESPSPKLPKKPLALPGCVHECTEIDHWMCKSSGNLCTSCGHALILHVDDECIIEADLGPDSGSLRWYYFAGDSCSGIFLGRENGINQGKVVTAVQVLEVFDLIFWPKSPPGAVLGREGSKSFIDGALNPGFKAATDEGTTSHGPLLFSLLRLSLLLLGRLHPCEPKALANVDRLQRLTKWLMLMNREDCTDAWVAVILVHTHAALRRIKAKIFKDEEPSVEEAALGDVRIHISNPKTKEREGSDEANVSYESPYVVSICTCLRLLLKDIVLLRQQFIQWSLSDRVYKSLEELVQGSILLLSDSFSFFESTTSTQEASAVGLDIKSKLSWLQYDFVISKPIHCPRILSLVSQLYLVENRLSKKMQEDLLAHWAEIHENLDEEQKQLDMSQPHEDAGIQAHKKRINQEIQIRNSHYSREEYRRSAAQNRWEELLEPLQDVWSPWAITGGPIRWKLSDHEDKWKRRMLLVRNFDADDHLDASYFERFSEDNGLYVQLPDDSPSLKLLPSVQSWEQDVSDFNLSEECKDLENEYEIIENEDAWQAKEYADLFGVSEEIIEGHFAVKLVTPLVILDGGLVLTNKELFFHPRKSDIDETKLGSKLRKHCFKDRKWLLERIVEVHGRRYLLRPVALEIYFADVHSVFIAFEGPKPRQWFYRSLREAWKSQRLPLLTSSSLNEKPKESFAASGATEKWRKRQISNFEYIMHLNVSSGRSYNDLTQYPVFPWILMDYKCENLDLKNSSIYRDLSKPVGALDPERLEQFIERYENFDDPVIPKFMYGSHYSSAGVVLHYLVRQEPFTSLNIEFQGGKFDCPDRLFFDIAKTWNGCNKNMSDVKELLPEFFCCPEILVNSNNFPLGELQDDLGIVNDVALPNWAHSPHHFVYTMRKALESEYVSQHLHHWIDLIFGYKQRGPEAVKAHNVFYYLTYEGMVKDDQIKSDVDREAIESQIANFGQTPSQLLHKQPHPARLPPEECVRPICYSTAALHDLRSYSPSQQIGDEKWGPVRKAGVVGNHLAVIRHDLSISVYRWSSMYGVRGQPFTMKAEKSTQLHCLNLSFAAIDIPSAKVELSSHRHFGQYPNLSEHLSSSQPNERSVMGNLDSGQYAGALDRQIGNWNFGLSSNGHLFSCGYWDNTVKVHSIDGTEKASVGMHLGAVNCLEVDKEGHTLVTGGQDATCRVWIVDHPGMSAALAQDSGYIQTLIDEEPYLQCIHILWGHEAPVTCLALSTHLDLVFSGASDGCICVHRVRKGRFVRNIFHDSLTEVDLLAVSCNGDIVAHSNKNQSIFLFSLNGTFLVEVNDFMQCLNDMSISADGEMLVLAGDGGGLFFRTLQDLRPRGFLDISADGGITCISFSPDNQYIIVGSKNGKITIVTDPKIRCQSLEKNLKKTFVGLI